MRSAESISRTDWSASLGDPTGPLDPATRRLLAESWLNDAREEHASVAAFARWSLLMLSVGAPPDLVMGSQRASLDEIEHAKACFALAERYGAGDVGPGALKVSDSLVSMSLTEIAVLTAQEGCVGETLGVALAMEQRRVCADPAARRALDRLIRDETRHAALAWSFVAWSIQRGGAAVRAAVIEAIEAAVAETLNAPIRSYDGIDIAAFHAHGRVTCEEAMNVARDASASIIAPAIERLRRGAPAYPAARPAAEALIARA